MDIEIKQKKYWVRRRYWPWIGGGLMIAALLVWLAIGNFTSTLQVDTRGLSIATVADAQFDDYVSLDGNVVPIQVVQISPEEGGVVVEKVVDEGSRVHKGDVIVRLSNSNLDLEILNAESELAEKQDMLRNTQLSMEQDQLNNRTEAAQLAMDEQTKKRALNHQATLQKEQLNSREDYLKAKEDYELAVEKNHLIRQRLSKSAQMRRAQMEQMSDNLASMQRNVELVRQRKAKLDVRSSIDGEVGLLDVELGQSITPGQKIGVINDLSDYKVEAQVDEHYIDRVHSGLAATFT
ncbi:MAG: HlyD family secretion protein, partial [Prevotella sp.]